MSAEQLNQIATQILQAEDKKQAGTQAVQQVIDLDDKPTTIHGRLYRLRQILINNGLSQEQAISIIHRSESEINRYKQQQFQNLENKESVDRIQQFKNPSTLKKRIKQLIIDMNQKKIPTVDSLIDIIVLFCSRINEIKTLKLNPQTSLISGFSKSRTGDKNIEREFISIYKKPAELILLQKLLEWIQSADWKTLFDNSHQQFTKYLKDNYQENLTAKRLREFGVDLIIQSYKPKNPTDTQLLIQKATRHIPIISSELSYGLVNKIKQNKNKIKKQEIILEQNQNKTETEISSPCKIYPDKILGFKIYLQGKSHIAKRKIGGKVISISLDNYYPMLEDRILEFCSRHNIQLN